MSGSRPREREHHLAQEHHALQPKVCNRAVLKQMEGTHMGSVWTFVRKPSNQRLITWVGGGGVVAATGIWAVVTYIWPAQQAPTAECIQQG